MKSGGIREMTGGHDEEKDSQWNWGRKDFPGGPVVKKMPPNARYMGSIPGRGTKIPYEMEQLKPAWHQVLDLCTKPEKPVCRNVDAEWPQKRKLREEVGEGTGSLSQERTAEYKNLEKKQYRIVIRCNKCPCLLVMWSGGTEIWWKNLNSYKAGRTLRIC